MFSFRFILYISPLTLPSPRKRGEEGSGITPLY